MSLASRRGLLVAGAPVDVQRADFRKVLANDDTDALIASLRRKIADVSDGAPSS